MRSTSIITPKTFLKSHLPQSTSATQTFTVSPTFPSGNFSGKPRHLQCFCLQITFHSFSFFSNIVLTLGTH